jgi:hypothetical protein
MKTTFIDRLFFYAAAVLFIALGIGMAKTAAVGLRERMLGDLERQLRVVSASLHDAD